MILDLQPLPLCACGAPAVFFRPGHDAEISEATDIMARRGQDTTCVCFNCNSVREPIMAKQPETPTNGPERRKFLDRLGEYTEIRFQQMRWASKAAKCLAAHEAEGGKREGIQRGFMLGKLSPEERAALVRDEMEVNSFMGVTTWQEDGQGAFTATFDAPAEVDTLGAGGAPIGSRLSLARAAMDGWNTAKAGGSLSDCKFAAESDEAKVWATNFGDGMVDRPAPKVRKPRETKADAEPNGEAKSATQEMAERAQAMDDGGKKKRNKTTRVADTLDNMDVPQVLQ
jgi:hypothetical protein